MTGQQYNWMLLNGMLQLQEKQHKQYCSNIYRLTDEICKYRPSQGLRQTEADLFEGGFSVHILCTLFSMEP